MEGLMNRRMQVALASGYSLHGLSTRQISC